MSSGPKSEHPTVKFLTIADRDKMLADVVILDWCSILEELFLNAIDAGAKNIKIWSVLFFFNGHDITVALNYFVPCTTANPGAAKLKTMAMELRLKLWNL